METQYLKTLCQVIATGSFSRAANDLCITQSAVSQRIRLLEERYGTPLLTRKGQTVLPTTAGTVVARKGEEILDLEQDMERQLQLLGRKRKLAVGCTPTFGIIYLPQILNRFILLHSEDVDLSFAINTPDTCRKGLSGNELDLAVIEHCGDLPTDNAIIHQLPPDELIFVSTPTLQLNCPDISLEELLAQRLIARREGCSSRCLLEENLRRYGRSIDEFHRMIIYDDLHLTIQAVMEGQGVAFVSRTHVDELIRIGKLCGHMVAGFQYRRSRSALINRHRSEDPLIRDFVTSLYDLFDIARDFSGETAEAEAELGPRGRSRETPEAQ
jgi:DNA-binding transcriptional LysR family regulator